ncbi:MAG: hypothetical protein EOL97_08615 [Spirochaetia bacterium]|nr:hypothetical protein [Spirochaetia bacterium]
MTLVEEIEKQDEFFSKQIYLSYSGLTKLLQTPILYYNHYILNERDDKKSAAAIEGELLHCLLLNPEEFDNKFVLALDKLPSDNAKIVIDRIYYHHTQLEDNDKENLVDYGNAIIDILADINLYQSLKTDAQRIEKITGVQQNLDYWEHLKTSKDKILVTQESYDYAKKAVEKIKSNFRITTIMGFNKSILNNIDVYNEIAVDSDTEYEFKVRGIIDNMVVDHDNKVIRINDFKKTSKHISNFEDSIEFWQYWLQAAIYTYMIKHSKYYVEGYTIEFRFIVFDLFLQVGMYKISEHTMSIYLKELEESFYKASEHFNNRYFDLPYKFMIEEGEITI